VIDPLLGQARQRGWWIIWDTSGSGGTGFHPAQNPKLAGRVVTIGSFSDRMPGWRVGWMAGSDQAKQLRAYKQSLTICSTSISQWAALGLVGAS
jgi:aspartate/methionine/tyrosine aminotransferase